VLATEETTGTQRFSHRPIKRQSRSWSQRGTKVNGPHHGDSPLLKSTGMPIATKPLPGKVSVELHCPPQHRPRGRDAAEQGRAGDHLRRVAAKVTNTNENGSWILAEIIR
ncbi:unnamed protein product, partial [Ascophyllum nodosum]